MTHWPYIHWAWLFGAFYLGMVLMALMAHSKARRRIIDDCPMLNIPGEVR